MDSQKTHKKPLFRWPSGKSGFRAIMSAVVCLVHVQFMIATYVKDILLGSTKSKQTVTKRPWITSCTFKFSDPAMALRTVSCGKVAATKLGAAVKHNDVILMNLMTSY